MDLLPPLDDGGTGQSPESTLGSLTLIHEDVVACSFDDFAEWPVSLGSTLLLFSANGAWVNRGDDNGRLGVQGRDVLDKLFGKVDTKPVVSSVHRGFDSVVTDSKSLDLP